MHWIRETDKATHEYPANERPFHSGEMHFQQVEPFGPVEKHPSGNVGFNVVSE
jgi:hypothetical protein